MFAIGICELGDRLDLIAVMCGSRGGGGGQGVRTPPLKNHKAIGFLSNTGPDPLKNHKATKPNSMLGHHRPASETPFKWRFTGALMMVHFKWYLDPLFLST